jgi:hypothetical protein
MLQFFGHMMKLPVEAFVYSMEMFVCTMRGIQKLAFQGIDTMADDVAQTLVAAPGEERHMTSEGTEEVPRDFTSGVPEDTIGESAAITSHTVQEEKKMGERDLGGDDLKLVRYKILFVKRNYEAAFAEQEALVYEKTDATGFTAWKTAEFIQQLARRETHVPHAWRREGYEYPPDRTEYRAGNILLGLPDEDKKYLRVYYEVLQRYPREELEYEDQQLRILREIRDVMQHRI